MEYSTSAYKYNKNIDNKRFQSFEEYKARREQYALQEAANNRKVMTDYADLVNLKNNRKRERLNEAKVKLNYDANVSLIGLTEALVTVVKNSLLLDINEYQRINENYEDNIRSTIKDFLSKANINENITNPNTIAIMESINAAKPNIEIGKCLNEAELTGIYSYFGNNVKQENPDNNTEVYNKCEEEIERLSGDVMDKVAERIDADSRAARDVEDQLTAMNQVNESSILIRNNKPKKTVLEVLTLNEANDILVNTKEYNPDLALANAITYITVLETLDASGLVNVGDEGYKAILEAAGEFDNKRVSRTTHAINFLEKADEDKIKEQISLYETSITNARHAGFKSFEEWKAMKNNISLNEEVVKQPVETFDYIDTKAYN